MNQDNAKTPTKLHPDVSAVLDNLDSTQIGLRATALVGKPASELTREDLVILASWGAMASREVSEPIPVPIMKMVESATTESLKGLFKKIDGAIGELMSTGTIQSEEDKETFVTTLDAIALKIGTLRLLNSARVLFTGYCDLVKHFGETLAELEKIDQSITTISNISSPVTDDFGNIDPDITLFATDDIQNLTNKINECLDKIKGVAEKATQPESDISKFMASNKDTKNKLQKVMRDLTAELEKK